MTNPVGGISWWARVFTKFEISVPPQISTEEIVHFHDKTLGISVPPSVSFDGIGHSKAEFTISVPPRVRVRPLNAAESDFEITVPPHIAFVGRGHYANNAFGISVPPSVGFTGAEHYSRSVGISVPPSIGFTATGNDGTIALIDYNMAAATSIAIPSHRVGDLIVILGAKTPSIFEAPTAPTAGGTVPTWTTINYHDNDMYIGTRLAYAVATATNTTSGTWDTSNLAVAILRAQATNPIGGNNVTSGTADYGGTAPGITLSDSSGSSAILHFICRKMHLAFNSWSTPPSGYTQRDSLIAGDSPMSFITKDVTTSAPSVSQNSLELANINPYVGHTVEILSSQKGK